MREADNLIGTVPAHINKVVSVLEQGVENIAKYWFLFLSTASSEAAAFLKSYAPVPQKDWDEPAPSPQSVLEVWVPWGIPVCMDDQLPIVLLWQYGRGA